MKVILIDDLRGTGKKGDVVEVKDGYGRNFLLPRGLALPATEGNVKRFEHVVKGIAGKRTRDLKRHEDVKGLIEQTVLTIKKKAGVDGRLFGSVTHKDVADAIKKVCGVDVDKKGVRMEDPIKMTGAYELQIHLHEGVTASVKIEVEKAD